MRELAEAEQTDAPFQLTPLDSSLQASRMALVVFVMLASFQLLAQGQGKERPVKYATFYRTYS